MDAVLQYIRDIDGKFKDVGYSNPLPITFNTNSANFDSFNRLRVSNPKTLLDSKRNKDALPLFFDDQETSGGGTTTTYVTNKAAQRIGVTANTAGVRVIQSKLWGNYQPGKSQEILITFSNIKSVTGITKMAGYFWTNWGIYVKHKDGIPYIGIRTYNTGSASDNDIPQTSWNIDKLAGDSKSGITLDFSKTQIFFIDFEWLGVGRVRTGFVIDGILHYAHEFLHTNINTEVYMSNPNAPIRYEIQNSGTGAADTFDCICSSIISEGGQEQTAIQTYQSRDGSPLTMANQDLWAPIISFRLKSGYACTRSVPVAMSILVSSSNTNYEWCLKINPTVAGVDAASWQNITNSSLQYDISRTNVNQLTAGYNIAGGYGSTTNQINTPISNSINSFLTIGTKIDGSVDEMVLCIKNVDGDGGTVYGGLTWSEYC